MRDGPTAFRGDASLSDAINSMAATTSPSAPTTKRGPEPAPCLSSSRPRGLREGEIEVQGPGQAFSGALEELLDLEARGLLRLRATFGDPETEVVPMVVVVDQDEPDSSHIFVDADERAPGATLRPMTASAGPIVVLAGGVGAARFLEGVVQVVPPSEVVAIVNVGDDLELAGLHISPDLDTITYTLAGRVDPEQGWGVRNDTFAALQALRELGGPAWFTLGDRDLGLHLYRTQRLWEGAPLSLVTAEIARALGVMVTILPVTDQPLRTMVLTPDGEISFQEYFVRRRAGDPVAGLRYAGAEEATAAPGVHQALMAARAVIIAPSNPFLSIGPILAVPGVRDCLLAGAARKGAVSPIIAGRAVKGPAAAILESLGHDVSALGIARLYRDLIDLFVIDAEDAALAPQIREEVDIAVVATPTLMTRPAEKRALAHTTLAALGVGSGR